MCVCLSSFPQLQQCLAWFVRLIRLRLSNWIYAEAELNRAERRTTTARVDFANQQIESYAISFFLSLSLSRFRETPSIRSATLSLGKHFNSVCFCAFASPSPASIPTSFFLSLSCMCVSLLLMQAKHKEKWTTVSIRLKPHKCPSLRPPKSSPRVRRDAFLFVRECQPQILPPLRIAKRSESGDWLSASCSIAQHACIKCI